MLKQSIQIFVLFFVIKLVKNEPLPDLVRVRRVEDAKGAEFYALDTVGLIERWGYPAEQHNVTTKDGYIINIFRIPWSPKSVNKTQERPVIFLQLGLFVTSDTWVFFGPNKSLAMQLADEGYDVWMGNYRGNTYGRAHVKLSPDERQFWDHSFHEVGVYDIPCMVDYVLDITNQTSMTYLAQSMGTTALLILLTEYPEYEEKFDLIFFISPVAGFVIQNPFRIFLTAVGQIIQDIIETRGDIELLPQSSTIAGLLKRVCLPNNIMDLCFLPLHLGIGLEYHRLDDQTLLDFMCYSPSGTSAKMFYHYRQTSQSQKFRQYDFEDEKINMKHYGQPEPPVYNLTKVRLPMIIFAGQNDPLSTNADTIDLMKKISSKAIFETRQFRDYNHMNFVSADNVKELVNDRAIQLIAQFRNKSIPYFQ